jgi:mannose-6-phosphate isomerase-like protein (cupin superfamily)
MTNLEYAPETQRALSAWTSYLNTVGDWQTLVDGVDHSVGGCGWVYELENPIECWDENFAIAVMNKDQLSISEPHYHARGQTEIYIGLSGLGRVIVGRKEQEIAAGLSVIIPSDTAHYTAPHGRLVMAVINVPSFYPGNYHTFDTTRSHEKIGFNLSQYEHNKPRP